MAYIVRHQPRIGLRGCPMNALLQPGMPMPADLKGLSGLGVAVPVPEVIQSPSPIAKPPAGHPVTASPRNARRLQVGGIATSAVFAASGLIASQQGRGVLASQLVLVSIIASAVVAISQLFTEEEGY